MASRLTERITAELEQRGATFRSREWWFLCIAHEEKTASAAWNPTKRVWYCQGCGARGAEQDLAAHLGLPMAEYDRPSVTVYKIRDASGRVVAEHHRYDKPGGKSMPWYRNGKKNLGDLSPEDLPLYGTHDVAASAPGARVVVVEGEKARDALASRGVLAVGTVTGAAGTPGADAWRVLVGHEVVLWADNDAPGYDHMARCADQLRALGITPRVFHWAEAPENGDAFDYFAGGGLVDALRAQLAAARACEAAPADAPASDGFVRAADLIREPEESVRWTVGGLLPARGLSLCAAKPKVGKSTLARAIAVAVAQGGSVLDRPTNIGPVLYLALEEKRGTVKRHLASLGVRDTDELHIYAARIPTDEEPIGWLRRAIERYTPALVVIDPIGRFFVGVRDLNDYAQVTKATTPLVALAHETGAHLLCIHHAGKGERADIDAAIGSTALAGSVVTGVRIPSGTFRLGKREDWIRSRRSVLRQPTRIRVGDNRPEK